jgi:hypothetical protein
MKKLSTFDVQFLILLALFTCAASSVFAQKTYPDPEEMKPGMSEFWLPQPAVVTPDDPSDPISFRNIWIREL